MAIKKSQCAQDVRVKLNEQFIEKCLGDKYLKEEKLIYLSEGHVYNDAKGEYVFIKGGSKTNSGYAYLNELDLEFPTTELSLIEPYKPDKYIDYPQLYEVESEKEIKSSDQIISDISKVLVQWDGKDLERIANQILSNPVNYIGDSNFEVSP